MQSELSRITGNVGFMAIVAVFLGIGVTVDPILALLVTLTLPALYAMLDPRRALAIVFGSLLLDHAGATGMVVAAIPITLSKLTVAMALVSWFIRAAFTDEDIVRLHSVLLGLAAVALGMVSNLALTNSTQGNTNTIGVIMLSVLVGLVGTAIRSVDLAGLFRFIGVMLVGMMIWTLLYGSNDATDTGRLVGNIGDPNYWATQLMLTCPLVIAALAKDPWKYSRTLLFAVLLLYPISLMQTLSRAGYLVFAFTLPVVAYLLREQRRLLVVGGLLAIGALPFLVDIDLAVDRMMVLNNPHMEEEMGQGRSLQQRSLLLRKAISLFKEHWFIGIGVGMFPTYAGETILQGAFKVAHNSYATVAAEQGLFGIGTHTLLIILVLRTVVNNIRDAVSQRLQNLAWGFAIAIGSYGLMAMTLNLDTFATAFYILGLGLAISHAATEEKSSGQPAAGMEPAQAEAPA